MIIKSMNPFNLLLRFFLELIVLFASGFWGFSQSTSFLSFVFAILIPLLLMVIWGVFAVPNDPSRSGKAPIPTKAWLRLIIEIGIFAFGVWVLIDMGFLQFGLIFGIIVLIHYAISYQRILWLICKN